MTTRDVGAWARQEWDRLARLDAQAVRMRVSELSDSDALGVVAAGTFSGLRWVATTTDRLGREAVGLLQKVAHRRAVKSARQPGDPPGRPSA
jgi:hypothetical protein